MEFRVLGPLEATDGSMPLPLGGGKSRALLARLRARREPDRRGRAARGRPLGRGRSGVGGQDGADLRVAAAQGAAGRDPAHAGAGLRRRDRPRGGRRHRASTGCGATGGRRWPPATRPRRPRVLRDGAGAVARARAGRVRRAVRARSRERTSRSCGWRASRTGSRPISPSVATRTWPASWRRSSRATRCARRCTGCSCSRSTAPAARPRRSRRYERFRRTLDDELGIEPSATLKELQHQHPQPGPRPRAARRRAGARRTPSGCAGAAAPRRPHGLRRPRRRAARASSRRSTRRAPGTGAPC